MPALAINMSESPQARRSLEELLEKTEAVQEIGIPVGRLAEVSVDQNPH